MRLRTPLAPNRPGPRGGYVIFAVLIVVVVLSLVAYRFTDSMTGEYRASVRLNDDAQLKMAAVSGLHYAAAVLSDRNTFLTTLEGDPYDNEDIFGEFELPITTTTGTPPPKRPFFSIRSVALTDAGGYEQRYGVIDEGGKLNINSAILLDKSGQFLHDALMKLPNMTEDIADAIVDWVDADDDARASGAESSYYMSLSNPYKAKNGPLNSLDELLLVKGVTPYLLYGGDTNRNGVQDDGEQDNTRGWADYLTVYGRELNVDSTGTVRGYVNAEPDVILQQLTPTVGEELATYIAASRLFGSQAVPTNTATVTSSGGMTLNVTLTGGSSQSQQPPATLDQLKSAVQTQGEATGWSSKGKGMKSVTELIGTQITLPIPPGSPKGTQALIAYSPLNDPTKLNDLLPKLLDKTTASKDIEMVPRINVNTAPREVLLGIPGMDDATADKIISQRPNQVLSDPGTLSAAWLVTTSTITSAQYKAMEKYLTGSTMVFRVQAIGYFKGVDGPVARMEAVIDTNQGAPRFLMVRDLSDLENPRGFTPAPPQN